MNVGSEYLGNGKCRFTVWAPLRSQVAVHIVSPNEQIIPMQKDERGYWQATVDAAPGTLYFYQLDGETDRPDPASQHQPKDVHGPSEVVDHSSFPWSDTQWSGVPLEEMIIYELHVGTFTPDGTFEAIIPRLADLKELGVNAIELMPIAQFPGNRNWGYDGAYPYAALHGYGGPDGLKVLVDACHAAGISVILDVVYNHMGPEGNYLREYGPYFTEKYRTVWGAALNYDDSYSDEVRNFFLENAIYWLDRYHIDGLRLDAIHAIYDLGAEHFLEEMATAVDERLSQNTYKRYLIAESELNDTKIIRPKETGGFGIDAQWCDDFHHCVHTLLTGEKISYYSDFGTIKDLEKSMRQGYVYDGTYSVHRHRRHGNSPADRPGKQFVVCIQNHDQVGNRLDAERLSMLTSYDGLKVAAATLFLSPFVPMLFMGEEYGEDAPFQYFVSHTDPDLIEAVRKGRKEEFKSFDWHKEAPDPEGMEVFEQSTLNWEKCREGKHGVLRSLYQRLIQLRQDVKALANLDKHRLEVTSLDTANLLTLHRTSDHDQIFSLLNFDHDAVTFTPHVPQGNWQKILDSSDSEWLGSGSELPAQLQSGQTLTIKPLSFVVYTA
ncbi:malto-oligosyltrehalose trehalohydrolase [Oculatella sp. LEGE 06141]|uniref:malto-oligosyltrehalose trehalohydrolase n=1 Tax=Oculatella sp. LEGE 06141 TaxID=1828648 RepID=UPI00188181A1|nr:malto-oligosyltrehalose trehalohydrolase [Oculatella sp. LEGE 06141]MBE9181787.1 malto-oligosyltrehalose trehalohydrolase [Oculatella sp. LEGE 06141]